MNKHKPNTYQISELQPQWILTILQLELLIDAFSNKHTLQYMNKYKQNAYQIFKLAVLQSLFNMHSCRRCSFMP